MGFVWNTLKATANVQRNGVSCEEAQGVFRDSLAITVDDQIHSEQESREIIIGHSDQGKLLFVCFTERGEDIRLISAREPGRSERNMKTTQVSEPQQASPLPEALVDELMADDMLPEYNIDYSKARPNRFAARLAQTHTVELEADVAAVFTSQETVNSALRALIQTMPQPLQREST